MFNFLGRDFFNALSEKDADRFTMQLMKYLAGFCVGIPVFVFKGYYQVQTYSQTVLLHTSVLPLRQLSVTLTPTHNNCPITYKTDYESGACLHMRHAQQPIHHVYQPSCIAHFSQITKLC